MSRGPAKPNIGKPEEKDQRTEPSENEGDSRYQFGEVRALSECGKASSAKENAFGPMGTFLLLRFYHNIFSPNVTAFD